MAEPKRCPFCGGESRLVMPSTGYKLNPVSITNEYQVKCKQCGAEGIRFRSDIWQDSGGDIHVTHNGAIEAIEAWNRRAEDETD